MTYDFTPLADRRHVLGEGARSFGSSFVYVDLLAGTLYASDGVGSPRLVRDIGTPLGAVAPTTRGGWVAAADTGFALLDDDITWLARPERRASTAMRMNDAAVDPHGRFWAGSMAYDGTEGAGSLYRLDPDLGVHKVLDGLTVPNGPVFDASGEVMYLSESSTGTIHRCSVDVERGRLGRLDPFVQVEDGSPDGMAVDTDGFLWSAIWGGSRLHRYAPDGRLDRVVPVPARQPTSIALRTHGPMTMLITSATHGLTETEGDDGRVLVADAHVAGRLAPAFGSPSP